MRLALRIVWGIVISTAIVACGSGGSDPENGDSTEEAQWLFAQSAEDASVAGDGDRLVLTLDGLSPVTVAFTDRPDRVSRSLSSVRFIDGWGSVFGDDPPNAALMVDEGEETAVITVESTRWADEGRTASYLISVLQDDSGVLESGVDLGPVSLFIDDAPAPEEFLSGSQSSATELTLVQATASSVALAYASPSGNQPNAYANTIYVWAGTLVEWSEPPLQSMAIQSNTPVGSLVFNDLDTGNTTYTFGYATGPSVQQVAATLTVGPDDDTSETSTRISIDDIGPDFVAAQYELPEGAEPNSSGHWVGLWEGTSASYSIPPMTRTDVLSSNSEGTVAITGFPLLRGTVYTLGYFTGPKSTDLAATVTFVV